MTKKKDKIATVTQLHEPDPFLLAAAEEAEKLSAYLRTLAPRSVGNGENLLRALAAAEGLTKQLDELAQIYEVEPAARFGELLGVAMWSRIVERHADYCKDGTLVADDEEYEIPDEALIVGERALGRLEQVNGMSIMRLVARTFSEVLDIPIALHTDELANLVAAMMMGVFAKKPVENPYYWLVVPHAPTQEMNLLVTVSNHLCGKHEHDPAVAAYEHVLDEGEPPDEPAG